MNRLRDSLSAIVHQKGKALALFLTAGFPRLDSTAQLVLALEEAGADLIELGMPFSDPIADGRVIQQCSTKALQNGATLDMIFDAARSIRAQSSIPLLLMGYVNPILRYGADRFFSAAALAGIDGVILPEVPFEEIGRFTQSISRNDLCNILLVAPTSPPERVESIDALSSGFVYCVSATGVTGQNRKKASIEYLRNVRHSVTRNPLLVGFGVSTRDEAHAYAAETDGVVIGSALLEKMLRGEPTTNICAWVRDMKEAISQ